METVHKAEKVHGATVTHVNQCLISLHVNECGWFQAITSQMYAHGQAYQNISRSENQANVFAACFFARSPRPEPSNSMYRM